MEIARLVYMANQIARNFAAQGKPAAIEATAQHIRDYWDPRMKRAIIDSGGEGLDVIARSALDLLRPADGGS